MHARTWINGPDDVRRMRLLALGRIPRCRDCPRYHALATPTHGASPRAGRLPAVPASCPEPVCVPLGARRPDSAA